MNQMEKEGGDIPMSPIYDRLNEVQIQCKTKLKWAQDKRPMTYQCSTFYPPSKSCSQDPWTVWSTRWPSCCHSKWIGEHDGWTSLRTEATWTKDGSNLMFLVAMKHEISYVTHHATALSHWTDINSLLHMIITSYQNYSTLYILDAIVDSVSMQFLRFMDYKLSGLRWQ